MLKALHERAIISRILRFIRFVLVGGLASFSYAIFALVFITWLGADQVVASVVAYISAIPVSFFGQKFFTFKSGGAAGIEFLRFLPVQGANLLLAASITAIFAHVLSADPIYGIAAVMVIIPLFTYAAMSIVVFRAREHPH